LLGSFDTVGATARARRADATFSPPLGGTRLARASRMPRTSRAISSATLSLGLVAIPVGIHATRRREGRISYHLVHAADGSRVHRQWVCDEEGTVVDDSELTRAYESEEGEKVVMSKEDVAAAIPKNTGRIDLIEFVPTDTIDPVFFDSAYYLGPGKGGDHAYHLLAETLRELGMVGVGTQIARGKSYLVAVRATELGLVMHTLHHDEEVHPEEQVNHGDGGKLAAAERELARSLVTQLQKEAFDAGKFEDEADIALRKAIEAAAPKKAAGEDDEESEKNGKRRGKAQIVDLMESLRASLGAKPRAKARVKRTVAKKPASPRKRAKRVTSSRA
jgi:DNA end-binding protein Ku